MSKNIVFEGWLTKSPPTKRIWRTKWRRRWFALRQSGELPGQYFLDYYTDRNYRRLKGTINLDLCEQVDAGLHMERTGSGNLNPKLRGSVFAIQTQSRTYHLEADCEKDMEKWVAAICRVCGLRATDSHEETGHSHENLLLSAITPNEATHDTTGPYIPISECITGVRAQGAQRAFTFDPQNIVTSARILLDREHQIYTSQPQIRLNNLDSENESTISDDEIKSLNASQSNIRDYSVAKSFTKLSISPGKNIGEKGAGDKAHEGLPAERPTTDQPFMNRNELHEEGPPVPPRPPKTLAKTFKEPLPQIARQPGPELPDTFYGVRAKRRISQGAPSSPPRHQLTTNIVEMNDIDDEIASCTPSLQYCNLSTLPPAVDRALKPRPNSHNSTTVGQGAGAFETQRECSRPEKLQYLDLDLMTKTSPTKMQNGKKVTITHSKSLSDAECAYKTVDFLKTEAFNITRQDAEASRSNY